MSAAAVQIIQPMPQRFTADALLSEPYDKGYELEDGQLVEMNVSTESSWVAGKIFQLISNFSDSNRLGWVFPEGTCYQCFANHPDRVRKPDTSFIRFGRLPGEILPAGHLRIAPDLAVEVLSPNDLIYMVERKVRQYFEAGVQLIWLVNPDTRTIRVHRPNGSAQIYSEGEEVSGENVPAGFRFLAGDVFPLVTARQ